MRRRAVPLLLGLAALVAAGCGGQARGGSAPGDTLTIYAAVPLRGVDAAIGREVLSGEKVALAESGGRLGKLTLNMTALDSTDPDPAIMRSTPATVAANARKAASDRGSVAYLGEVEPGASAVSVLFLNEADTLQVSPLDTFAGLTESEGDATDEPARYYPSGSPSFGRLVPDDTVQARALAGWMHTLGLHRVFLLDDQSLYGRSLAAQLGSAAPAAHVAVAGRLSEPTADFDPVKVAAAARRARADAVFYGAIDDPAVGGHWNALAASLPGVRMLGAGALATPSFAAALSARAGARTFLTSPALPLAAYGAAARPFERSYRAKIGRAPGPWSILGYEAMAVTIDSIRRAGPHAHDRHAIIEAFLSTHDRHSVLGRYTITAHGATTRTAFAAYRVRGGRLAFTRLLP